METRPAEVKGSGVTFLYPRAFRKKPCPLKEPVKRASRCHVTVQNSDRKEHTLRLRSLDPPSSVSDVPGSLPFSPGNDSHLLIPR
ncbi:hypothetical protein MG293_020664 [Ovis ammon polii]|uniref:Uncharacterized protein n=1 Tax=Ovis ammon polii TaxID=230172 RepID=A0AAD4TM41_OVIAM|nr:hypothetical protein MG293_020664 [Ovis ammon polii]